MYLAIDIGGTKTLIALFDSKGNVKKQLKIATPAKYEDFCLELAKAVVRFNTLSIRWAIVAAPGFIDRKHGVVKAFGNLNWLDVPLQKDVEKILHAPTSLENDSKLAGLSEAIIIQNKYKRTLYVTISTGINGALIKNGKIDKDFQDMEVGQMLLEYRGKLTDWEDFSSGRAFTQKFGKKVGETADDDHEAWYWLARNIAIGLVNLIATLTPEVIIIGGGAGAHLDKFKNRLDEQLKTYENPMFTIPPIIPAKRPNEAVIYGCYELAKQHTR